MFEVEGQAEQVRERGAILCKCARIGIQQKGKHENCTLMRDIFFLLDWVSKRAITGIVLLI